MYMQWWVVANISREKNHLYKELVQSTVGGALNYLEAMGDFARKEEHQ
jgi:hypothetical protein